MMSFVIMEGMRMGTPELLRAVSADALDPAILQHVPTHRPSPTALNLGQWLACQQPREVAAPNRAAARSRPEARLHCVCVYALWSFGPP